MVGMGQRYCLAIVTQLNIMLTLFFKLIRIIKPIQQSLKDFGTYGTSTMRLLETVRRVRMVSNGSLLTLLRLYYGVHIPDSNAPFRLMKASLVAKYINKLPQNFNLPNVMLTTYFAYFKENITFRKITFAPRQGGVNSINIPKIVKIGWHALGDFRMLKKHLND